MSTVTISNPRTYACIEDWPFGRHHRCKCVFNVEETKRGERVSRVTENKMKTGWNKPKKTTYETYFAIVDGDDGRTYLLSFNRDWQVLTLRSGDMKQHVKTVRHDNEEDNDGYRLWDEWGALLEDRADTNPKEVAS